MIDTLEHKVAEVRAGLREKLGLRGSTLAAQLRRGGRLLPRYVRRDATYLAQVVPLARNPKLHRLIDQEKVIQAHRNVLAHLQTIDPVAQRRETLLNIIAAIAFAIFATGILVIVVIWWRGLA